MVVGEVETVPNKRSSQLGSCDAEGLVPGVHCRDSATDLEPASKAALEVFQTVGALEWDL